MLRAAPVVVLLAALSHAPLQCTSEPDPGLEREETPGEALYRLAQEFRAAGNRDAWRKTLEHLIERYPSSRFAVMAQQDLKGDEAEGGGGAARAK